MRAVDFSSSKDPCMDFLTTNLIKDIHTATNRTPTNTTLILAGISGAQSQGHPVCMVAG